MSTERTFEVTAKRWEGGLELHIEDVGVTQSLDIDDADSMIVDLISQELGLKPGTYRYNLDTTGALQPEHTVAGLRTPCPAWCDGQHPVLYQAAGEPSEREHYREVGRVNDGGPSVIVVGIAMTTEEIGGDDAPSPSVQILHLLDNGAEVPELVCGEVYLSAAEACTLAPLLLRAAEIMKGAQL